jgi:hypothetical protein
MQPRLLIEVLNRLVDLYERLLRLAAQQREFVQLDQTDELLAVLTKRAGVVEQISKLEGALRPTRMNWPDVAPTLEAGVRTQAEELLARTRNLLADINAADTDDALVLQQRKLDIGRQLAATRTGTRANAHYATTAYTGQSSAGRVNLSR